MRQHAIAALNLTQQAKEIALRAAMTARQSGNTALIDGVRKFAMDVRELDIDLIDRINPFGEAYAILAKTMSEESLKQVAAVISAKQREPDAGGGARPRQARREVQAGARTAAVDHLAGCLGEDAWPRAWPSSPA